MQAVDFNSDMGESFGPWTIGDGVDAELMAYISSANIATGFHAGDPGTMRRTVERAKQLGVAIGAHPGFHDLVGFGSPAHQCTGPGTGGRHALSARCPA